MKLCLCGASFFTQLYQVSFVEGGGWQWDAGFSTERQKQEVAMLNCYLLSLDDWVTLQSLCSLIVLFGSVSLSMLLLYLTHFTFIQDHSQQRQSSLSYVTVAHLMDLMRTLSASHLEHNWPFTWTVDFQWFYLESVVKCIESTCISVCSVSRNFCSVVSINGRYTGWQTMAGHQCTGSCSVMFIVTCFTCFLT